MANIVVGTDGGVPVYEPEGRWCIWSIAELWQGKLGKNRYVPKVNDWVTDPETREWWIVDHLDPITFIPTLRPFQMKTISDGFSDSDTVLGSGPGEPSTIFRMYVNSEVRPSSAAIDAAVYVYGTMASYVKIFKGTIANETSGLVISKVFDSSGNLVSTSVPLELAALDSHVNYAVKSVKRFSITDELADGEIVTMVVYADDGHVVYKRQLLVENTNTIIDLNMGTKYIRDIYIKSTWLNKTVPYQIDYPINIPLDALNILGVVEYSDGSKAEFPINSTNKFRLIGLDTYLSTIPGQQLDLVLSYQLASNELALSSQGTNNRYITKPYSLVTTNPQYSIQVKLFGFPVWISDTLGYNMKWYLLNAERNMAFDVTSAVKFSSSTGPFDPLLYGYVQRKQVMVALKDVNISFPDMIHTQLVDIYLADNPTPDFNYNWLVGTHSNDSVPKYGGSVEAHILSGNRITLKANHDTKESWIEAYFDRLNPIKITDAEHEVPRPSHFQIYHNSLMTEVSMDDWDKDITLPSIIGHGQTIFITYIKRTGTAELKLAVGAVLCKAYT